MTAVSQGGGSFSPLTTIDVVGPAGDDFDFLAAGIGVADPTSGLAIGPGAVLASFSEIKRTGGTGLRVVATAGADLELVRSFTTTSQHFVSNPAWGFYGTIVPVNAVAAEQYYFGARLPSAEEEQRVGWGFDGGVEQLEYHRVTNNILTSSDVALGFSALGNPTRFNFIRAAMPCYYVAQDLSVAANTQVRADTNIQHRRLDPATPDQVDVFIHLENINNTNDVTFTEFVLEGMLNV